MLRRTDRRGARVQRRPHPGADPGGHEDGRSEAARRPTRSLRRPRRNLVATVAGPTQINLTWTASGDNVGVTGYRLERCQGAGCSNFAQIATPTGASYSDTGLQSQTSYSYRVRAVDAALNLSGFSNIATATTQAPMHRRPRPSGHRSWGRPGRSARRCRSPAPPRTSRTGAPSLPRRSPGLWSSNTAGSSTPATVTRTRSSLGPESRAARSPRPITSTPRTWSCA